MARLRKVRSAANTASRAPGRQPWPGFPACRRRALPLPLRPGSARRRADRHRGQKTDCRRGANGGPRILAGPSRQVGLAPRSARIRSRVPPSACWAAAASWAKNACSDRSVFGGAAAGLAVDFSIALQRLSERTALPKADQHKADEAATADQADPGQHLAKAIRGSGCRLMAPAMPITSITQALVASGPGRPPPLRPELPTESPAAGSGEVDRSGPRSTAARPRQAPGIVGQPLRGRGTGSSSVGRRVVGRGEIKWRLRRCGLWADGSLARAGTRGSLGGSASAGSIPMAATGVHKRSREVFLAGRCAAIALNP